MTECTAKNPYIGGLNPQRWPVLLPIFRPDRPKPGAQQQS